jgi:hypothetical protein
LSPSIVIASEAKQSNPNLFAGVIWTKSGVRESTQMIRSFVMAGLVPAIHLLLVVALLKRGCPGQARA